MGRRLHLPRRAVRIRPRPSKESVGRPGDETQPQAAPGRDTAEHVAHASLHRAGRRTARHEPATARRLMPTGDPNAAQCFRGGTSGRDRAGPAAASSWPPRNAPAMKMPQPAGENDSEPVTLAGACRPVASEVQDSDSVGGGVGYAPSGGGWLTPIPPI